MYEFQMKTAILITNFAGKLMWSDRPTYGWAACEKNEAGPSSFFSNHSHTSTILYNDKNPPNLFMISILIKDLSDRFQSQFSKLLAFNF